MSAVLKATQSACLCVIEALFADDKPRQSEVMRRTEEDRVEAALVKNKRATLPSGLRLKAPDAANDRQSKGAKQPEGAAK
jgi:hypothetical protein